MSFFADDISNNNTNNTDLNTLKALIALYYLKEDNNYKLVKVFKDKKEIMQFSMFSELKHYVKLNKDIDLDFIFKSYLIYTSVDVSNIKYLNDKTILILKNKEEIEIDFKKIFKKLTVEDNYIEYNNTIIPFDKIIRMRITDKVFKKSSILSITVFEFEYDIEFENHYYDIYNIYEGFKKYLKKDFNKTL